MKINAVISSKKLKLSPLRISDKSAMVSFAVIAAGIIFGAVLYLFQASLFRSELWNYFIRFSVDFSNKNKSEILSGLIISNLPYVVLMIIFGACALGVPAIFILSFFKSAGLGALICYIYNSYALEGIEYCLLVLFPAKVILLFAMLLLTQSCYTLSKDIYLTVKTNSSSEIYIEKYIVRSFLICCIFFISSLTEFFSIISFSSLFSFS